MATRNAAAGSYKTLASGRLGLRTFREVTRARRRAICFPFGGGLSHLFSGLAAALPDTWSVWGVDAPGHLQTRGEPVDSVLELCRLYLTHLGEEFFRGAWLVGHSLGGLVAARLAHELEEKHLDAAGCVVCAVAPPHQIDPSPVLSQMTDETLRARWDSMLPESYRGISLGNLFETFLPVIRADLLAYESCAGVEMRMRRTPMLAIAGTQDAISSPEIVRHWSEMGPSVEIATLDGRHLFVLSHPEELAQKVVAFARNHEPKAAGVKLPRSSRRFRFSRHALPTADGSDVQLPQIGWLSQGHPSSAERLVALVTEEKQQFSSLLLEHGAILFRGFGVTRPDDIGWVMAAFGDEALDYSGGNSPRTKLGANVYTSTEYPAELEITPHPELCYAKFWPSHLYFACGQPAAAGGATPLVDLREMLSKLDSTVVNRFMERGLLYIRRLHGGKGFGRSWKDTFETENPGEVEGVLRKQQAEFEWIEGDALLVKQSGAAVHSHPVTGEKVWFNQAEQWHPAALPQFIRDALGTEAPHDIRLGDGSAIRVSEVEHIREVLWNGAGQFRWEAGDLLVLDNERMAHGRRSFRGQRRVLVSMGVTKHL